ncbi:WD40/YVTN/BNR-like repeat-containing protein [Amphritea sp.]|uniref:WD40/YVTN/BNR-like repeat-containing protein n=1 Tax=Amphritea sp. TaxID=1872502 RepID=UPI003D0B72FF
MKVKYLLALLGLFIAASNLFAADQPPLPAAALDRPALQSPKSQNMAILSVTRAGDRVVAVGERGIVLYSDDSGQTWTQARTPTSATLTAVRFANDKRGWAVGHMGIVLHTEDAGVTWVKQLDGIEAARLSLEAAQQSGDERAIRDAQYLIKDGADKPFFDICLLDDNNLMIIGAYNLALRSENGGQRWTGWQTRIDNPRALHLYAMQTIGTTQFIAGEQGLLLRSDDNGQHFTQLESPYHGSWFGLLAEHDGSLLAYGLRGNAYLTTDLGNHWQQVNSGTPVSLAADTELEDGRTLLVSQAGEILVSTDNGLSFSRSPKRLRLPLTAVTEAPDGLVVGSLRGVHAIPFPAE